MRKIAFQILIICLLTLIPALGSALFHPKRPSWNPNELRSGEILLTTVLSWEKKPLWIDARSRKLYEAEHVPEAILLNEDEWDALLPVALTAWQPDQPVVIYCDSALCQASQKVAERLREAGLKPVYVLKNGWEAWRSRDK